MFTKRTALTLALASITLLGACHGVARKPYTPGSGQPLRTVGMLVSPSSQGYVLVDSGFRPALMFGAVGGLVAGLSDLHKTSVVTEALRLRSFDAGADFYDELERAVRGAGYEVIRIPAPQRGKDGFVASTSSIMPRTDLYLDAHVQAIGFETTSMTDPWHPLIAVPVRLVSGANGEVLYSDLVTVGGSGPLYDGNRLANDPKYTYAAYTDIRDRADSAVEGLRGGLGRIASEIGRSIGRGSATIAAESPSAAPIVPVSVPATTAAPAPAAAPAMTAVVATTATPKLGRCELSTVHAMKRDGASESEIQLACQATIEDTRSVLSAS